MDTMLIALVGLMAAVAAYLMMGGNMLRFVLGLGLLSNAVNLSIFAAGRLTYAAPPLIDYGDKAPTGEVANALPQALILTAIVIGFGLMMFTLLLVYRLFAVFGTMEIDEIDSAEPREH